MSVPFIFSNAPGGKSIESSMSQLLIRQVD
jgi:hypothetical protein